MSIFSDIEAFVTTKVWPFLKNIGKSAVQAEITTLQPVAEKLVASAEADVVAAAASGSTANLGVVLGKLISDTAAQAETLTITAGATSLLSSVGTALATNTTTAPSLAVSPKPAA